MTYKEKKEELEKYISATRRIACLQSEYEQWQTIATSITQKLSPVIVNTNDVNSRVERCGIKCVEIEKQILEDMSVAEYERQRVQDIINTIRDSRKREILTMRFVNGASVRKIAILYDADENSIYKQIRRAISRLDL